MRKVQRPGWVCSRPLGRSREHRQQRPDLLAAAAGQQADQGAARVDSVQPGEPVAVQRGPHRVHERVADKVHRHPVAGVELTFERQDDEHPVDQPADGAHPALAPRPRPAG